MPTVDLTAAIGSDLRDMREQAGISQQAVADLFGRTRDSISKIERGINSLTVPDYLEVVAFLSPKDDHPAMALYRRMRTAASRANP